MKPHKLYRDVAAMASAFTRVGEALVVYWREVSRADESTLDKLLTMSKLPSQRILDKVEPHEVEAVLQRLHRLRVLCDVQALDFMQMTQFAIDVHAAGERSWDESLDTAIESVETSESVLSEMNRLCREVEEAVNAETAPDVLDAPNARLPFLFKRRQ